MIRRSLPVVFLLVAATLPLTGLGAAPAVDLDSLLKNSPFGTGPTAMTGNRVDQPLEYRGVSVEDGKQYFSLYEVSSRTSAWLGVNESGNPFEVQSYDATKDEVTVNYRGRIMTLPLKQAKIVNLVQAPPQPPPGPGPNQGPQMSGQPQNMAAMTPADEAVRLAAVAEEIRRRRALRAAPPQSNPGGPVPMPMPMPPRN